MSLRRRDAIKAAFRRVDAKGQGWVTIQDNTRRRRTRLDVFMRADRTAVTICFKVDRQSIALPINMTNQAISIMLVI